MTRQTAIAASRTQIREPLRSVRARLACGILAGPLFLVASYAQAITRNGFDVSRDAFSYLSLGPGGWIQMADFVLCGLLFIAGATAVRQVMQAGPGHRWAPRLIAIMGVAMVVGGVFRIDPSFGYPPGAPAGKPDTLSWHGVLHAGAFTVAIMSWLAASFAFALWFLAQQQRAWAAYSAAVGLALLAPVATIIAPPGALLIYAAATFGWTWTSAVIAYLLRRTTTT